MFLGQSLHVSFSNKQSYPHGMFDSLSQYYINTKTPIPLPSMNEPDPFEPFIEAMSKHLLFANEDFKSIINMASIPDATEQSDMLETIILCIGFFYKSRKQYDIALRYFQILLEVVQVTSELMVKMGSLSDVLVEQAWMLIFIGDTLYMKGDFEGAKGHYRQAGDGLDATKNRLAKKELFARLSNKTWGCMDSHFIEFYTPTRSNN
jgi:hypothetical protein